MHWMFARAQERAKEFGIQGVTLQLTQGVVKNIIPAIASTNAIVAASCALETLKLVTLASTGLDNYLMYSGVDGVYTLTTQYERDPACPVCSAGVPMTAPPTCTLRDLLGLLTLHPALGRLLREPSLSVGSVPLYARGVFEEETRPNLDRQLRELVTGPLVELTVNDKGLVAPLKVQLRLQVAEE
ncbi:UBA3 [Auxenochlorella protothecoides x Auxenochlorella symbiontica]